MTIQTGDRVRATMTRESHYLQVEGPVTGFRNGFTLINADRVMDRWTKKWSQHPTGCAVGVKAKNVEAI